MLEKYPYTEGKLKKKRKINYGEGKAVATNVGKPEPRSFSLGSATGRFLKLALRRELGETIALCSHLLFVLFIAVHARDGERKGKPTLRSLPS